MDQPARPAAVSLAHSTAMHLISDSLADRQDERVPDGPLEFPVVIVSLAGMPGVRFSGVFAGAHVRCALS
jgi:hypothetical protein